MSSYTFNIDDWDVKSQNYKEQNLDAVLNQYPLSIILTNIHFKRNRGRERITA